MSVVEELVFEGGPEISDSKKLPGSASLDDALESEVEHLAALISTSADPVGTVALVQKRLLAVLARIEKSATA